MPYFSTPNAPWLVDANCLFAWCLPAGGRFGPGAKPNHLHSIEHFKAKYQLMFDQLLSLYTSQALMFHCTAGKDRTGFGAALVLSALGVDRATILKDYAATDVFWKPACEQMLAQMHQASISAAMMRPMLAANPVYLQQTFDTIDKQYGSMDTYLVTVMEFSPVKLAQLKSQYVQ